MQWRVIEYREFHDVPRMVVAANEEGTFLFYSRFDEEADDYLAHYEVYRMPHLEREALAASWEGLEHRAIERRSDVPVKDLPFKVEPRIVSAVPSNISFESRRSASAAQLER